MHVDQVSRGIPVLIRKSLALDCIRLRNKFVSLFKHVPFRQLAHVEKTGFQRSVIFKRAVSMDMGYLETCLMKFARNQQGSMAFQRIFFRAH